MSQGIELPAQSYQFTCPPDSHWLPSHYTLFAEKAVEAETPSPEEIKRKCEQIRLRWDDKETVLRKIRAEMACTFGVCRTP